EPHPHSLETINEVEPNCTDTGNIAYWYCQECNKYYKDAYGAQEINIEDTVLEALGHDPVIDEAVPATNEHTGLTEGSHCGRCGKTLVTQVEIPKPNGYSVTYNISNGDKYLAQQEIINPAENPRTYYKDDADHVLQSLQAPEGYKFLGWYDGAGSNATQIKEIKHGNMGNIELYAHWEETVYDITYKLYQTPLAPISDEKYLHYTVSKGLVDLPNPTLYNYIFLGWYDNDGEEVKKIPVGTTGNIELNAYWISKRNLAKKVNKLEDPVIIEDPNDGVIYFTYEIGSIENVPVSDDIWTIQSVHGLAQQKSQTVTNSITSEKADEISNMVSLSTVDSKTWTLSSDWNDITTVNEEWAESNGMTQEEAITKAKTTSNTFSLTSSNGGSRTDTKNGGTTTLSYDSKETIDERGKDTATETGSHFDIGVNGKYAAEGGVTVKIPEFGDISGKKGYEIGGNVDYGNFKNTTTTEYGKDTTNNHSGSDTTTYKTTVGTDVKTWNSEETSSSTQTDSESRTVSNVLSHVVSETKSYGKSYAYGGSNSESQGISNTTNKSTDTSSTLSYSNAETTTTTTTYSTDGKSEGCYRLVIAGTVHVFAVVGYDVATKSYFTYTFNVMDDKIHEFLDYSPDLNFNDCEYGAIPFEVPIFVNEYVDSRIVKTNGLSFKTNSEDGTATVVKYTGQDEDVKIPCYISSGKKSYKVTSIDSTVFAGKDVHAVILSDYIDEIPDSAFENCSNLEIVSGFFSKIGNNAFKGCTNIKQFTISSDINSIGTDAFEGVKQINATLIDSQTAFGVAREKHPELDETKQEDVFLIEQEAQNITKQLANDIIMSGADNVSIDISKIFEGTELELDVPEMESFEIDGGKKTYKNLSLKSKSGKTTIREVTIPESKKIPFDISSNELELEEVSAKNNGFVLLLENNNTKVTLIRDNKLISNNEKALVCKNPKFESLITDDTIGVLDISGNIYVCGNITGASNIDFIKGEIVTISEDEFNKYIKGEYTISFDANGGATPEENRTIYYGDKIGTLPQPAREDCVFLGWYTSNGDEITEDDIYNFANDITLRAHWKSDWVLNSALPQDATQTNEKWSYDLISRTSSGNPTMDGWTQYDSSWVWGPWGDWSPWSRTQYYPSDSRQVEKRTVTDRAAYTSYKYSIFRSNDHHTYGTYGYAGVCYNPDSIEINYQLSGPDGNGTYGDYKSPNCSHSWCTRWFYDGSVYHAAVTHDEWRYRDRSKVWTYYFTKTEQKESETEIVANGDTITNVQKWVKYIIE
ncbi:MAG: InlB B-repeat-containing protein, partial [Lachnospiraceae bacterium]|nr:InlB B-repeat-containing protein [Lachnospiraceae bacterium]